MHIGVDEIRNAYDKNVEGIYNKHYYKLSDKGKENIMEYYERNENFAPRPNQQQVVDNFEKAVKSGRKNLLMYVVMRFGKSAVSAWCSKKMGAKLTVIVSGKARCQG